jgi:hypothetical protein
VGVWVCGCVGVGGCVYKIEKFRTLSAPSEMASLREAISSSAAFELMLFRLNLDLSTRYLTPRTFNFNKRDF